MTTVLIRKFIALSVYLKKQKCHKRYNDAFQKLRKMRISQIPNQQKARKIKIRIEINETKNKRTTEKTNKIKMVVLRR